MRPKRAIKELEKQLRKDSENLVLRLKLAAVYREVGRTEDAVALYRSVAVAYHGQGRLVQAIAVCKSVLEIDPTQRETQALLEELNRMRAAQAAADAAPTSAVPNAPIADDEEGDDEVLPVEDSIPSVANMARPRGRRPSPGGLGQGEGSGMRMPLASPDTPPMGAILGQPSPLGQQPHARPGVRGKRSSTQRMSEPPAQVARPSSSLITPTPLPRPLALHDADADSGDLPELVAPGQDEDEAMTTIADDSGLLPQMPSPPREPPRLPTAPPPLPPQPEPMPPPLSPEAALPILPARPPTNKPLKPMSRPKAQPSFFEQETRLVVSMDDDAVLEDDGDVDADDLAVDDLDAKTRPGGSLVDEDALTPPPRTSEMAFPEEPTNPRPAESSRSTDVDMTRPLPPERDSVDNMVLEQAFDRSFSGTIRSLAPDGSAIDTPLTLFGDLPEDALIEMSKRITMRTFRPGDLVIREGDPGDACFVVAVGEVRVLKRNPLEPQGDLVEVARLGQGALFGEFALLADRRRHATVQAVGNCELYEVPRRLLRELAASYPDVGPLLENFYRERLLATLLATAPFFKPLQAERRAELLSRFKPMRAESGERIVSEGRKAGGLYLIVLGSVEIIKRVSDKRMVLLATLGEGAYFGEMSLLKGGAANASVIATGPTELAVMPPRDFYEVVSENPLLWDEVRREANRRQLEMNQIVTGETNVV